MGRLARVYLTETFLHINWNLWHWITGKSCRKWKIRQKKIPLQAVGFFSVIYLTRFFPSFHTFLPISLTGNIPLWVVSIPFISILPLVDIFCNDTRATYMRHAHGQTGELFDNGLDIFCWYQLAQSFNDYFMWKGTTSRHQSYTKEKKTYHKKILLNSTLFGRKIVDRR